MLLSVKLKEDFVVDIGVSAVWADKSAPEKGDRYTCEMNRSELMGYFQEVVRAACAVDRRYFRGRKGGSLRGGESILEDVED